MVRMANYKYKLCVCLEETENDDKMRKEEETTHESIIGCNHHNKDPDLLKVALCSIGFGC